jgi:hypothetical protein
VAKCRAKWWALVNLVMQGILVLDEKTGSFLSTVCLFVCLFVKL